MDSNSRPSNDRLTQMLDWLQGQIAEKDETIAEIDSAIETFSYDEDVLLDLTEWDGLPSDHYLDSEVLSVRNLQGELFATRKQTELDRLRLMQCAEEVSNELDRRGVGLGETVTPGPNLAVQQNQL